VHAVPPGELAKSYALANTGGSYWSHRSGLARSIHLDRRPSGDNAPKIVGHPVAEREELYRMKSGGLILRVSLGSGVR